MRSLSDWENDTTSVTRDNEVAAAKPHSRDRACVLVLSGSRVGSLFHLERAEMIVGRSQRADIAVDDDGVSRSHARLRREGEAVWLEDLGSRNGTFVNGVRVRGPIRLADGDKVQLGRGTILKFTYHDALDDSYQERLIESALRDGLTRLYNKRYFDERIDAEVRFARRHASQLGLLLIDVDHFKKINDGRGHLAGDAVLQAVAHTLAQGVRTEDVVARYGGEEIVVLTRAIGVDGALHLAERLRRLVEELRVEVEEGPPVEVTVSIGVAVFPAVPIAASADLIAAADRALYRAKQEGRNRVVVAEGEQEATQP
ncbi:MAG TPA: GGDEF domain-containing protein [Kofleriaceae bacterium]|nr:GGDEF domain-containing protein [Kofleriaceae bacterium]